LSIISVILMNLFRRNCRGFIVYCLYCLANYVSGFSLFVWRCTIIKSKL